VTDAAEWYVLQRFGPARGDDAEHDPEPGDRWRDEMSLASFRNPSMRTEVLRGYREEPDAKQVRFVRRTEAVLAEDGS
jgi:hypothetical protein